MKNTFNMCSKLYAKRVTEFCFVFLASTDTFCCSRETHEPADAFTTQRDRML